MDLQKKNLWRVCYIFLVPDSERAARTEHVTGCSELQRQGTVAEMKMLLL
jgi:hypothetical protein